MKITRETSFVELPELLTPAEVRAWLGVGRSTIYDLIRRKDLPSRRIGRRVWIPRDALKPEAAQ